MCDPAVGMTVLALTAGAPGVMSGIGTIQQGQTARTMSNMNADLLRQSAKSAEDVAAQQAADQKMKARKILALQVVQESAAGIDPSTGTPIKLAGETVEMGELDSLRIINNASRMAWGQKAEANIKEYEGEQTRNASYLNAFSTLLGSGSNAFFGAKSIK